MNYLAGCRQYFKSRRKCGGMLSTGVYTTRTEATEDVVADVEQNKVPDPDTVDVENLGEAQPSMDDVTDLESLNSDETAGEEGESTDIDDPDEPTDEPFDDVDSVTGL